MPAILFFLYRVAWLCVDREFFLDHVIWRQTACCNSMRKTMRCEGFGSMNRLS